MDRNDVQQRIDKKESKAYQDLEQILKDYNCTVTQTPAGTHWDATITSPFGSVEYVELKRRNCRWEDYEKAMALKVTKANFLKQVQEETGVKVVVLLLYPKSNCFVSKTLDEIIAENDITWYKYKVTEMDDDSDEAWQRVCNITLKDEDKRTYTSICSF